MYTMLSVYEYDRDLVLSKIEKFGCNTQVIVVSPFPGGQNRNTEQDVTGYRSGLI